VAASVVGMRAPAPLLTAGLSAALLLLAGCGGSDEGSSAASSSSGSSSSSAAPTTSGSPAAPSSAASPDAAAFCAEAVSLEQSVNETVGTASSDPTQLPPALQRLADQYAAIEPPAEIAADWNALADGLDQIAAAFAEVDLTDPAAQQALGQKIAELQGPLDTASTNVETYLRDECGLELDSGESAAPSS
jgi:hypothetical protein